MTEFEILQWFGGLWPAPLVNKSVWLFAFGETVHFIGLTLLIGSMLIVDLRLMGFFKRIPVKAALGFLPYAVIGFVIMMASGWELFTANPLRYWPNPSFRVKMFLVVVAGLNALVFTIMEHRGALRVSGGEDTSLFTKTTAGLSLTLWILILVFGRMIPVFDGSRSFFV